jgi:hypothetical protein
MSNLILLFFRRNWEIFILFAIGLLLLLSLNSIGEISPEMSRHALARAMVGALNVIHRDVVPVMLPISVILGCGLLFIPKHSRMRRTLIDYYAIWYSIRILMTFILINLLLFIPVPDHSLLALQVVLFLPCLLMIWGWIYWRLDQAAAQTTGESMFVFSGQTTSSTSVYDYFLASFNSLLSHTLSGFSGRTRTARSLIFVHGIMIWDVMGLILTRAIASVTTAR